MTQLRALLLCLVALVISATPTLANPQGGQVTAGSATISGEGTGSVTVQQSSARAVIDWTSFSIGAGERTSFLQPDSASVTLNRVTGADPSRILGSLEANGTVILVNRNGILFSETARVDASGLVVTTHDLANDAFMAGSALRFDRSGNPQASIVNQGTISIRNAGLAAFVAPHVVNDGVITANYGRVALGAGSAFTLDLHGDSLISFQVGDAVTETIRNDDGTNAKSLVENKGRISAAEGRIQLTAEAARAVVNQSVNVTGTVEANSLSTAGGRIVLSGSGTVMTEKTATLNADGVNGGQIAVTGNAIHLDGRISADGSTEAPRTTPQVDRSRADRHRSRALDLQFEDLGSTGEVSEGGKGGTIKVEGGAFTSLDGMLSASAWSGGAILTTATRNFALNGQVMATGAGAQGGRVSITAGGETWEGSGSGINVSGTTGGTITNITQGKFVTSANYLAAGWGGAGGTIDVTGGDMLLLSSTYNAAGLTGGGTVRLGGEFQGGKALATDEIPNARKLAANDGVKIDVSAKGGHGDAGTAIIWSDEKTTFLGSVYATGGLLSGTGGLVEASSADSLIWRGTVETAVNGERGGTLLLDPKNITIADAGFSQLQLILGAFGGGTDGSLLDAGDGFGWEVSLDGLGLAVGAWRDDGAQNSCNDCGAVYLFNFVDTNFSSIQLTARIGHEYTGGNNINLSGVLSPDDQFGFSVSLNEGRLAVGAWGDDGAGDACYDCGAVYLFGFADLEFSGGTVTSRMGTAYSGYNDIDVSTYLNASDWFGSAVSLDGNRLAVGAYGDDGATESCNACGAIYLFTFHNTYLSGGTLVGRAGDGYSGINDFNLSGMLDPIDLFGGALTLDGNRLVVGSEGDAGISNSCAYACGAAYLFTFGDMSFSGISLAGRIGHGYTDNASVDLTGFLGYGDGFGYAVALRENRLVIGAAGDEGQMNDCPYCGAVYMLSFAGEGFLQGSLEGIIGHGYVGGKNIDLSGTIEPYDFFGTSVSLDSNQIAVGVHGDDGANNSCTTTSNFFGCGSVYLFRFGDSEFSSGDLLGAIGDGYSGGLSRDLNDQGIALSLSAGDQFGNAVDLDGNRLAVGVYADDGADNDCADCGAVHLFQFDDDQFSNIRLAARIGSGYTGGRNINLPNLFAGNNFGLSVSLDDTRLAVGVPRDRGYGNACGESCGAVYLFSFDDLSFSGGTLTAMIGHGYAGTNDLDIQGMLEPRDFGDTFGHAVSLDGNRLAVGALWDDGLNNTCFNCGAVYLFTFQDAYFSGGELTARLGDGYVGSKDINLSGLLDAGTYGDAFGGTLSLDGNRLLVGSLGDDGLGNDCPDCGAAYLFGFDDALFAGGSLTGRFGHGYTGNGDLDLSEDLRLFGNFGAGVSLDGSLMAIGAQYGNFVQLFSFASDDLFKPSLVGRIGYDFTGDNVLNIPGIQGTFFGRAVSVDGGKLAIGAFLTSSQQCGSCGAVYLFNLDKSNLLRGDSYGSWASDDATISPGRIMALLNAGTNVTLQASNDITVNSAITAANPSGAGGDLTLQAGRSIFVNANIFTDDGDLTLIANDLLANGVVDAYRDPGAAVITMAPGTSINAGAGSVLFDMRSGAGKTNATGGAITLTSVTGGTITAQNTSTSDGDIVLAPGANLTATSTGNGVVLAAGDQFINNAGATPIATPNGRFMIYSQAWGSDTRGGIEANNLYNRTYGGNPPASISQAGNLFIYAAQPMLTVTGNAASRVYGAANPVFTASITGLVNGDSATYAYAGTPGFSTTTTPGSNVGSYLGDVLPTLGQLVSDVGYGFNFVAGDLTIDPASLTITASNASKTYGQTASLSGFTTSGLLFSDSVTGVTLASLGAVNTASVGSYAINASGATGTGLSNYAISYVSGVLGVNPAPLTITANDATKRFRQALTFAGTEFTVSGLLFSDTVSSVTLQSLGAGRLAAPRDYAITPSLALGTGLGNYAISYVDGVLTVTGLPRPWVPQPANDGWFRAPGFFEPQNDEVLFCSAGGTGGALVACAP